MIKQGTVISKPQNTPHRERPRFSSATMEVAKKNLKAFQVQSDEAFLIRADMDRKLSSL